MEFSRSTDDSSHSSKRNATFGVEVVSDRLSEGFLKDGTPNRLVGFANIGERVFHRHTIITHGPRQKVIYNDCMRNAECVQVDCIYTGSIQLV